MRLIDRDALREIIGTHCRDLWEDVWNCFDGKPHRSRDYLRGLENGYWEIKKDIEQLPTIDPVKWIPVSERLPEENGRYLVTCEQRGVADAKYWHRERVWVKDWAIIHVTAWMPLPEPYAERREGNG